MKKLLLVAGARPQFIKIAPVMKALMDHGRFEIILVHTGQHYDANLSDIFFTELEIPKPKYNLEIGSSPQSIQIGNVLSKFSPILESEKPDLVIVFGDTNSTSAAALCAATHKIPVAHIEAGLREYDKSIPEEINKLITDALATLYFCPTITSVSNLKESGIRDHIYLTGDVGFDLINKHPEKISKADQTFNQLGLKKNQYYFATCHRAANTDNFDNLFNILEAFNALDFPVVLPIHPRTVNAINKFNLGHLINNNKCLTISPIGFWETQFLIKEAKMVFTDSGGVIKEAYYHRVPSIIIDKQTEWMEILNEGWSKIAGPDQLKILELKANFEVPKTQNMSLGQGNASEIIAGFIYEYLQHKG